MLKKSMVVLVALAILAPAAAQAKGVRRPANDEVAAASVIQALPFSETVNLAGATLEPEEPLASCGTIRSSVWYALSLREEGTVIGEVSSTFSSVLAVYEQSPEGVLQERACAAGQAGADLELEGAPGTLYLVQLSAAGKKQGLADLSFRLSSWREVELLSQTIERSSDEQHLPILRVTGAPRQADSSMYDVTIQSGQLERRTFGVLTFGLVKEKLDAELVRIPASATSIRLEVVGRYDSSQYRCAADDGGGTCYASTPVRNLEWVGGGDSANAELVVTVAIQKDGATILERSQSVPYAGQALGLVP